MAQWNFLTLLRALFWNSPLFWNFLLMICNFPLLFSHFKNIQMSTLITIIFTYQLLINYHFSNNYKKSQLLLLCRSYGVMFIKFVEIDCFLCNSCVLFKSLSHVINQESHVYSWNLGKIYLAHFLKFWNLPRFNREISKFQKSELGKFIPNFPLKHVITSTNWLRFEDLRANIQNIRITKDIDQKN